MLLQRGRIQSAGSVEENGDEKSTKKSQRPLKKSKSLLSSSTPTRMSPSNTLESKKADFAEEAESKPVKKITNLNEFYKMTESKSHEEMHNESKENQDGKDGIIDYSMGAKSTSSPSSIPINRLPPPAVFGDGNPFLMFMCIACILQHRDYIMEQQLDYQVS